MYDAEPEQVLQFLQHLMDLGNHKYGTFNSHRSALSLLLKEGTGQDYRIKRFLKGVSNLRPFAPKYDFIWDTEPLEGLFPHENLSIKFL